MITQANGRRAAVPAAAPMTTAPTPGAPVARLRGASVDADVSVVGRVVLGLLLFALAVSTVVLYVAGVHRNDQITELHRRGVAVEVTVTGCLGLLGGSGSNAAGYQCRGAFVLDGHRYVEAIPGDTFHAPGSRIRGVTVPGDPALLSTAVAVASEHASGRVFVLPSVLLALLVLALGALWARRRRRWARDPSPATVASP